MADMQILRLAGWGEHWRMWKDEALTLGTLKQGVFPEQDYADLGQDLHVLIRRSIPIFEAPWGVKAALEKAGVKELRSLTPSTLRYGPPPSCSSD